MVDLLEKITFFVVEFPGKNVRRRYLPTNAVMSFIF